jgi:hypothetical protein
MKTRVWLPLREWVDTDQTNRQGETFGPGGIHAHECGPAATPEVVDLKKSQGLVIRRMARAIGIASMICASMLLPVRVTASEICAPQQSPSSDFLAKESAGQETSKNQQPATDDKPNQSTAESLTNRAALSPGRRTPPLVDQPSEEAQLPDAPTIYAPPSGRDKLHIFLRRTYEPYTFASAVFEATWAQMWGQWPQYGGGVQGWSKRFGATLADTESRNFIQTFLLSTLLHQDPRYFPSRKTGLIPRAWYAGTRVLVTRRDDGQKTSNTSELLGALFTSSLQNAYYPRRDRGLGDTMNRFVGALGSDASSNVLREFWPDMRRIFRKHAPKEIEKLEKKIPQQVQEMASPNGHHR